MNDSLPPHAQRLPAPALRPFISHYAGFRAPDLPPGTHTGVPSRHIHLIISLAAPIEVLRMPDETQRPAAFSALVSGLQDAPAVIGQGGRIECLHVFLRPHGVRAILGVTSRELTSRVVSLPDIMGKEAGRLTERLREAGGWEQRFAILDRAFLGTLRPVRRPRVLGAAWQRLAQSNGRIPVHQLAGECGLGRRHFGELFHAEFGVAPKLASRIFRFERACRLIAEERPKLSHVAFATGFHDEAHLSREWTSLAGCAPGTWIAKELPNLQDYELAAGGDRDHPWTADA